MQIINSHFKICATCGKWGGQRNADGFGSSVQIETNTIGNCYGGIFNNNKTAANSSCAQYVKWAALK